MDYLGIRSVKVYVIIAFYFNYELCVCQTSDNLSTEPQDQWKHCVRSDSGIVCNYIPKDIPAGTKTVHLKNLSDAYFPDKTLRTGSFSTYNWGQVKSLEFSADSDWLDKHYTVEVFQSSCFDGLQNLEVLRIHISNNIEFTQQTLNGLTKLNVLDLSGCHRFGLDNLMNSLNQSGLVPNLHSLYLSHLNSYREGLKLTDQFFKIIYDKQIKELDISSTQIIYMNLTAFFKTCHFLEYFNISRVKLISYTYELDQLCPNLKYVDAGYITLPTYTIPDHGPTCVVSNKTIPFDLNWVMFKNFRSVEYINLSALTTKRTTYSLENVTIYLFGASEYKMKVLILRENNLDRLNMKLIIPNCKIEKIDLSSCNLRYLHPAALSSFLSLTWIDVSKNRLNVMMKENADLFGKMFQNLSQLRYIYLANNYLTDLPPGIFEFNIRTEIIDLSNNHLNKFPFESRYLNKLKHLRLLNLTSNMIKNIDAASLNSLDKCQLLLMENPISCSSCDSHAFIHWLLTSKSTDKYVSELKCENENSDFVDIGKNVVGDLQEVCNRPKVIIISGTVSAVAIIVLLVLLLLIRRYRRRRQYKLQMENRVALIRQGAESYRFAVFLSYCSKDDDFVTNYVIDPLNEHLQNLIGDDRDLVCEGDRNFRLGRPIPEQISVFLKKSSVVVVLLTDNYCLSVYCRNEFDQAFMLEKPIVLMIKDQVDTDLMTAHIQDLYEKRTRILWEWENGQYALKTSWENVCTSIVELVDNK